MRPTVGGVQVSILAMYLSTLLAQTALGVVLSVWILNLHFRDDQRPPGKKFRLTAFHMQRLMCKRPWKDEVKRCPIRLLLSLSLFLSVKFCCCLF